MKGVELLGSSDSAYHVLTTSGIESMQHLGMTCECRINGESVKYMKENICPRFFMN